MGTQTLTENLPQYSRVMPHDEKAEKAVLCACLVDVHALPLSAEIITDQAFYRTAHQEVYAAMMALHYSGLDVDLISLMDILKKRKRLEAVGGPAFLAELTSEIMSGAHLETHCRILVEQQIKREVITRCTQLIDRAYAEGTDALDLADRVVTEAGVINNVIKVNTVKEIGDVAGDILREIREAKTATDPTDASPVASGLDTFDDTVNPQGGDVVLIAARPAMGKTSFVQQLARETAKQTGKGVVIASLEMTSPQVVGGILFSEAGVNKYGIRNKRKISDADEARLEDAKQLIADWPIKIIDGTNLTPVTLRARCKQAKLDFAKEGIELGAVIIDYLQLMSMGPGFKGSRENEVSTISRSLKTLSMELDVPVFPLAQLSRAAETRGGDKRPRLSDLRESGSLEQDADTVVFLYRPEYYKIKQYENGDSTENICELDVQKSRHGEPAVIKSSFKRAIGRFYDPDVVDLLPDSTNISKVASSSSSAADDDLPF
jgi:replicative DNA helicase